MYRVYLQRMTVESRDQIVHHRNLDLKKPAVRLSQFQEYPTQALLEFVNFRNPSAVDICHQGFSQGYYIGISSWFIQAGETQAKRKNRAHA